MNDVPIKHLDVQALHRNEMTQETENISNMQDKFNKGIVDNFLTELVSKK